MISKIEMKFDPEEDTANRPVVTGKDARQDTNRWLQKLNYEVEILNIFPVDNNGQRKAMEHGSGPLVLLRTSKKAKHGKMTGLKGPELFKGCNKESNARKDSHSEHTSQL